MGCCVSGMRKVKVRMRQWPSWAPWRRRAASVKEENVPRPSFGNNSLHSGRSTGSGRVGGYEKSYSNASVTQISSRMIDVPWYVGIFEHKPGGSKAELSIRKGDMFRAMGDPIGESDPEWLFVMRKELKDRRWTGYVPKANVAVEGSLEAQPYYFGSISTEDAEKLLANQPDGTFLVRSRPQVIAAGKNPISTPDVSIAFGRKAKSDYMVSVKHGGKVTSRPIYQYMDSLRDKTEIFFTKAMIYDSIPRLIESATFEGAGLKASKLPCALKTSPPKKQPNRTAMPLAVQGKWREIPRGQITTGKTLGQGHFGEVYQATWATSDGTKLTVAVKALRKQTHRAKKKFLEEAATMKNLNHKNLVKLYGVVTDKEPFWIVTEFVKDGSLKIYLSKRKEKNQRLPEKSCIDVCIQICDAMKYLEEKKVVHRDLAARNVLVSEETQETNPTLLIKVADFGLALLVDPSKLQLADKKPLKASQDVPIKWSAPEVLKNASMCSTASDVWSFGVVIHEIFTHGMEPYGILTHPAVRDQVLNKKQIIRQHESVPAKIYDTMKKCFNFEPKSRPTFKELHTYFRTYYRTPGETSIIG